MKSTIGLRAIVSERSRVIVQDVQRFLLDLYDNLKQNQWIQTHAQQINATIWAVGICFIYGIAVFIWNEIEGTDHHPKRFFVGSSIIIIGTFLLSAHFIVWFVQQNDLKKLLVVIGGIIFAVVAWFITKNVISQKEFKEENEHRKKSREEEERRRLEEEASLPPEVRKAMEKWRLDHMFMIICWRCGQLYNEINITCPHCGADNIRMKD